MADRVPVIRRKRGVALPAGAVYVGRGSRWGNPFVVGTHGTRAEVIESYRGWIAQRPQLVNQLHKKVRGQDSPSLACWCAPLPCHADVLAELLAGVSGAETQPDVGGNDG